MCARRYGRRRFAAHVTAMGQQAGSDRIVRWAPGFGHRKASMQDLQAGGRGISRRLSWPRAEPSLEAAPIVAALSGHVSNFLRGARGGQRRIFEGLRFQQKI